MLEKLNNTGTPLFWLITVEKRVLLMQYTWEHYHRKLEIPPVPVQCIPEIPTEEIPAQEIDKMMRQTPSHVRKVE